MAYSQAKVIAPSNANGETKAYMHQLRGAVEQFREQRSTNHAAAAAKPAILSEKDPNGFMTDRAGSSRIQRSKTMPMPPTSAADEPTAQYGHPGDVDSPPRPEKERSDPGDVDAEGTPNASASAADWGAPSAEEFASPNAYLERTFSEAVNLLKTPRARAHDGDLDEDDDAGVDEMAVDDGDGADYAVPPPVPPIELQELPALVPVPVAGCGEAAAREAVEMAGARHAVMTTMVNELRASHNSLARRYEDVSRRLGSVQGELKRASKECSDMRTARRSARAALAEMAHQNARLVQVFVEKKQEVRQLTEELAKANGGMPVPSPRAGEADEPSVKLELEMLRCELNDVAKARDAALARAKELQTDRDESAEKLRRQCERLRAELRDARHVVDGNVHERNGDITRVEAAFESERERWDDERRALEERVAKAEKGAHAREKEMSNEMAVLKDQLRLARAEARRMPSPVPPPSGGGPAAADDDATMRKAGETQTVRFLREETERLARDNARLDRDLRKLREEKEKFQSAAQTEKRRADAERRKAAPLATRGSCAPRATGTCLRPSSRTSRSASRVQTTVAPTRRRRGSCCKDRRTRSGSTPCGTRRRRS